MKKFSILFFLISIFGLSVTAENVPVNEAEQVAKNIYFEHTGIAQSNILLGTPHIITDESNTLYYAFNIENHKGFVIVAAENRMIPVLGYSTEGSYSTENQPISFKNWMQTYSDQIAYIIENNIVATESITKQWKKYNCSSDNFVSSKSNKSVTPLLGTIAWDQGSGWNSFCPVVSGGPGGRAYAGCVATAQGQVMKFWEHPEHGIGSSSYWTVYGTLSVDYSEQVYNWGSMSNTSPTTAAAELLYHIGVSVQMQYGASGSGTYTHLCVNSLESYFRYDTATTFVEKADYGTTEWEDILKNELENGRPIIYSGVSSSGGHAFVCDGYSGTNSFHFNWGWSGYQNGNFYLTYVNGFNEDQKCLIGVEPDYEYPPENMEVNVTDNDVVISWEIPSSPNKDLTGYQVFRDNEAISPELSSGQYTYTDEDLENGTYTYCIKAIYPEEESICSNEEEITVNATGILDNNTEYSVYPNPTTGTINILNTNVKKVSIIDVCGKNVFSANSINKIDISHLDKGIYFINISTDNKKITKKIILQ